MDKYDALKAIISDYDSCIVAFSGGVDSSLVAYAANDVLGEKAHIITADAESLTKAELDHAVHLAKKQGFNHSVIQTSELAIPEYVVNDKTRCYHCKKNLHSILTKIAEKDGRVVFDGTNKDDHGDYRPGLQAVKELNIVSPLSLAGFTKEDVRATAKELGLSNWNKPAEPCLSSRISYGEHVTLGKLSMVEESEKLLKELGCAQVRVRYHKGIARIEVHPEDFQTILDNRLDIDEKFRALGFRYITLDLKGFRSGSMNEVLHHA
ncbi:ATP-dependent sacrificial sulfur transferase LarE [Candidatus Woesearchaeota archaeon]|nr:ATP-dependent sacrificial sulfur transferase LarE [Candidatus Woesearchaeota archaeon]